MTRMSIGVFSWNVAKLLEAVAALEKAGHFVSGYEVRKLVGYGAVKHDKLVFLEYAPDVLEAWKSKGDVGAPKIEMPPEPRAFGDPAPVVKKAVRPIPEAPASTPETKEQEKEVFDDQPRRGRGRNSGI